MPADLHRSLEECEQQAKELVAEIKQYKAAKALNQQAAAGLDQVAGSLERVIKLIHPLTGVRLRRFIMVQTVAWSLTTLLVIAMLVMVIMGKLQ